MVTDADLKSAKDVQEEREASAIVRGNIEVFGHYSIENRAIPRVYDGLKPVQRRILWSLFGLKRGSRSVPVKCATVAGKVIGEYHPHGDQAAYDALVGMGWMRYQLVERHGNFGSDAGLEKDPPAAMRYTETRMAPFGERFFDDISVVPIIKSFTDEHEEPIMLPARVPVTLVNGCSGIATGLRTGIPPHNLQEVIDACAALVEDPSLEVVDLCTYLQGPDFGSAVLTSSENDLIDFYENGEGRLNYRCAYHIEEGSKSSKLVITAKAPGLRLAKLISETTELAEKKLLVTPINDEGTLDNPTRLTIEFTDYTIIRDRVLPLLETNENYWFYALDEENKPRKYNLKSMLEAFIDFRTQVEAALLKQERAELRRKLNTEKAKLAAIQQIDDVVEIVKTAPSVSEALDQLEELLGIEQWQAEVILNSSLRSLMSLNEETIQDKIKEHRKRLREIKTDLKNVAAVVVRRLREMERYSDKRGMEAGKKDVPDLGDGRTIGNGLSYVGVTPSGRIDRFGDVPLKSKAAWNYVDFIRLTGEALIVSSDNTGQFVSSSYLDKFDPAPNSEVIGVMPITTTIVAVVVIAQDGSYVAFDPDVKKDKISIFRQLESPLMRAVALRKKDTLIVRYEDGQLLEFRAQDLRITRPNVNPRRIGGRKTTPVQDALLVRSNEFLITQDGEELGEGTESVDPDTILFSVSGRGKTLVVTDDGKRSLKMGSVVLDFIEKQESNLTAVVPLPPTVRRRRRS